MVQMMHCLNEREKEKAVDCGFMRGDDHLAVEGGKLAMENMLTVACV